MDYTEPSRTLHGAFCQAASKWPQRVAVATTERSLTFADLDRESDQLAARLILTGVVAGQTVPVAMSKGWQQVVAIYAVLKAGAVYQPIDPDSPLARLRWLVEATCAEVIVTAHTTGLPQIDGVRRIIVDDPNAYADVPLSLPHVSADQLAYVMFTSGSTGEPKGVMVEHQAARTTLDAVNSVFHIAEDDVVLGLTAATFDLSVWDLFGALGVGATLVLPDRDKLTDVDHWMELIRRFSVTTWNTVPALGGLLAEHVAGLHWTNIPTTLRRFFFSGDVLPPSLPMRLHAAFPDAEVVNLFGPTEASIWCLWHIVDTRGTPGHTVPLGVALPGHVVEILDDELRPVSVGQAGEIYISGNGLARGYWNAPDLTRAAFPQQPQSGKRVYRTGDRARVNNDGHLEFLGRADRQVKFLGHRIELTEVEARLRRGAPVRDAAVVTVGSLGAYERLVGFVLLEDDQADHDVLGNLTEEVRRELPRWMCPAEIRVLEDWPLTPNGKLNWSALTKLAESLPQGSTRHPESSTEVVLVEVLQELLQLEEIDIEADLSTLGVNSLVASQVAGRLRRRLDLQVPIDLLLRHRSVVAVASALQSDVASHSNGRPSADPTDLRPVPLHDKPVRASFGQDQVWFLDRLADCNRAYHFQCSIRFNGALDVDVLRDALNVVVARHEILRTVFVEGDDGHPVQVVRDPEPVDFPLVDVTRVDALRRETEVERLIKLDMARTFDLASGPLIRWTAYKLSDTEWIVTEIEHHLVHDGWSVAVLWQEVEELYSSTLENRAPKLPVVALQFGDYAAWQRRQYTGKRREKALMYWTDKLAGSRDLDLAIARLRPARQTFNGHAIRFTIPKSLYLGLRKVATKQGISLYSLMASGYMLLLHRYSGQDDISVGSWMANREEPATENLIGMLVNMVVLRTQIEDDTPVCKVTSNIHAAVGEAMSYQDAPFDDVVRALNLPRDPSRNPLVQVSFSFHDSPIPDLVWPARDDVVRGRITELNNDSAKFDMNIVVIPRAEQRRGRGAPEAGDELAILWEYNTDLFDKRDIQSMIDHYLGVLDRLVELPADSLVGDIVRPTDRDRQRMKDLNASGRAGKEAIPSVVERFAYQVETQPAAIAISDGQTDLSYTEVDQRVELLRLALTDARIRPGSVVGICLDRGVWQPIAMLTLLRMGATYVPLDPRHPSARLRTCLKGAGAELVLTSASSNEHDFGGLCREVRLPGNLLQTGVHSPHRRIASKGNLRVNGDSPAYIVHTSGSTGAPKGVVVPRRALDNVIDAFGDLLGFTTEDCLLSVTTLAFDIAALEMLLPLSRGGRLVIADHTETIDGELLAARIDRGDITAMQATPMTWRMLLAAGWRPHPNLLILCGGERLDTDLADKLSLATAWNLYGPSETTIWSTAHRIHKGENPVPIGRPVARTTVDIVDQRGRTVPTGLPGELVITGAGVAVGYTDTNNNMDRFVDAAGTRAYRTGDMVRVGPSGAMHFLGRADRQIKLHGYRIELGEIEAALRGHPDVKDAAAFVESGSERLTGLITTDNGIPHDLDDHLRRWLPKYMVPASISPVPTLPQTHNNKIDRALLEDLVASDDFATQRPKAPTMQPSGASTPAKEAQASSPSELETCLAAIWAELLEVDDIDPYDDFFELGGHSLLALLLVNRVKKIIGKDITVEMFMDNPTLRALAESMDTA
ncbi:non-ribosomal peptide synthetase [Brevibacterium casei]|uniref:non-ribosomal peptide synthetase n=1 Tax=Brevibacterium casei TaxID=33889 RepID=UPI00223B3919|nr:non-ribosomal peptide synthetase [Brevibacterium casei]MCT1549645.1 amino acid adenylation domain-containing protein [Brevibacterium casei]MCT1559182.1 amino acid adenylation domain-containing protein [Brevibacterium casei]MCT2207610.1 amino acid adenylation domain-containing protein [Brevibacterium casei]